MKPDAAVQRRTGTGSRTQARRRRVAAYEFVRTVCAHVDERPMPLPVVADEAGVLQEAAHNRVLNLMHLAVHEAPDSSPALRSSLSTAYVVALHRQREVQRALEDVSEILEAGRLPWVTFKGPVLAHRFYARPDARSYGDLDVLVGISDVTRAIDSLVRAGFAPVPDPAGRARRLPGQMQLVSPTGAGVDLHWELLDNVSRRSRFAWSAEEVLRRRTTVAVASRRLPTLDDTDTLLHLCLHAAMDGGHRLAWLVDIKQVLQRGAIDWDDVSARARARRLRVVTALMLSRARSSVGAEVPDRAFSLLGGASWRVLDNGVARILARGGQPWSPVVAASTHSTVRRSVWTLTRRLLKGSP